MQYYAAMYDPRNANVLVDGVNCSIEIGGYDPESGARIELGPADAVLYDENPSSPAHSRGAAWGRFTAEQLREIAARCVELANAIDGAKP